MLGAGFAGYHMDGWAAPGQPKVVESWCFAAPPGSRFVNAWFAEFDGAVRTFDDLPACGAVAETLDLSRFPPEQRRRPFFLASRLAEWQSGLLAELLASAPAPPHVELVKLTGAMRKAVEARLAASPAKAGSVLGDLLGAAAARRRGRGTRRASSRRPDCPHSNVLLARGAAHVVVAFAVGGGAARDSLGQWAGVLHRSGVGAGVLSVLDVDFTSFEARKPAFDAFLAKLRGEYEAVSLVGSSRGAFGALRFARRADRVLAFSPMKHGRQRQDGVFDAFDARPAGAVSIYVGGRNVDDCYVAGGAAASAPAVSVVAVDSDAHGADKRRGGSWTVAGEAGRLPLLAAYLELDGSAALAATSKERIDALAKAPVLAALAKQMPVLDEPGVRSGVGGASGGPARRAVARLDQGAEPSSDDEDDASAPGADTTVVGGDPEPVVLEALRDYGDDGSFVCMVPGVHYWENDDYDFDRPWEIPLHEFKQDDERILSNAAILTTDCLKEDDDANDTTAIVIESAREFKTGDPEAYSAGRDRKEFDEFCAQTQDVGDARVTLVREDGKFLSLFRGSVEASPTEDWPDCDEDYNYDFPYEIGVHEEARFSDRERLICKAAVWTENTKKNGGCVYRAGGLEMRFTSRNAMYNDGSPERMFDSKHDASAYWIYRHWQQHAYTCAASNAPRAP
ncbi:hypothetical protein JL720_5741 [Aureococcus anophagefferens]|nr:hypothetical protein JL720_5741 [Aureococcus anophagefferens]